ncbi:heat-inducible transcriptional repressor HrcA [Naumannella halotolerans]|uniref:Heat-inducible transcription repressor HrcA n=1 Tax=Naumannella halotolerans TaxID=993414 RepID=A0A4R7J988_9ACTN|nr:heat-inducible transcriptional repressor HrcA [Naumannella halotolerans]TDT33895.1 heat-inducible transcriptional repressor [Naumannella halotolerans]
MMEDRKLDVLRAIVTDYVSSHEPVGSKALVDRHNLGVSSATVRNDMAVLEEEGYITQPHTSAGRIPTDKGYRFFVDRIASIKPLSPAEARAIKAFMSGAVDLDDIVSRTVRLLAQVTHQVAIVQYPIVSSATVRHVELVSVTEGRALLVLINSSGRIEQRTVDVGRADEDDLADLRDRLNTELVGQRLRRAGGLLPEVVAQVPDVLQPLARTVAVTLAEMLDEEVATRVAVGGVPNLTSFGAGFDGIRPILEALEEQVVLLKLLGEAHDDTLTVRIGAENPYQQLSTTSVIASSYGNSEDVRASLGVVGPTRMDYPSTMASVRAVARYVGRFLSES